MPNLYAFSDNFPLFIEMVTAKPASRFVPLRLNVGFEIRGLFYCFREAHEAGIFRQSFSLSAELLERLRVIFNLLRFLLAEHLLSRSMPSPFL